MQSALPSSAWYVPTAQSVHLSLSVIVSFVNVPGRQWRHASSLALPGMGFALPGGHAMHEVLLWFPVLGSYVPAGHGVKAMLALYAPTAAQ